MKLKRSVVQSFHWNGNGWRASLYDGEDRMDFDLREADSERLEVAIQMGQVFLNEARQRFDYLAYLASPTWSDLRGELLTTTDGCVVCTSKVDLDVHHRTYERFGHEDVTDLIVLCRDCHTVFHQHRRLPMSAFSSSGRNVGDRCELPKCGKKLILVNGALVCPNCDNVMDWPNVKKGKAEIER